MLSDNILERAKRIIKEELKKFKYSRIFQSYMQKKSQANPVNKKLNQKSQAAMEFLMTYGWAILIILIVLAALFAFGVFNPGTKSSCKVDLPFICQDVRATEDGIVEFSLSANNVASASIDSIKINDNDCKIISGKELRNNQKTNILCQGPILDEGSKTNAEIKLSYKSAISDLQHSVEGDASSEVEEGTINENFYDLDTFDQPYPSGNDDWWERNSINPSITSSQTYSGNTLYMPSGWGGNFEGGSGLESGQTSSGYNTNNYPYMCMAYKIPSVTINNMLILLNDVGWRSITMTQGETPTNYPKVASWNPLITDNQWHYKCINLDQQLDSSLGTGTHIIPAVIWHDGYPNGVPTTTGEFWIDNFAISKEKLD